jgi:hypothetical protein
LGSVEVSKRLPDGKIQIITKLDRNYIFGEKIKKYAKNNRRG